MTIYAPSYDLSPDPRGWGWGGHGFHNSGRELLVFHKHVLELIRFKYICTIYQKFVPPPPQNLGPKPLWLRGSKNV